MWPTGISEGLDKQSSLVTVVPAGGQERPSMAREGEGGLLNTRGLRAGLGMTGKSHQRISLLTA